MNVGAVTAYRIKSCCGASVAIGTKQTLASAMQMSAFGGKADLAIDPNLVLASIFNDKTWGLKWQYSSLFHSKEENPPVVNETCDILDMYRLLASSFDKLSASEKKRVQNESKPFDDYVKFHGFDFNNDDHAGVLSFLVENLKKYDELGGVALNSHSIATLPKYRKMLEVYKPMTNPYPHGGLTADQIIQILKA
jgi:uncharacterized protein